MFDHIDSSWPQNVQDRLHAHKADDTPLLRRVAAINAIIPKATRDSLLMQAVASKSIAKRLFWLRREADLVGAAAKAHSACSSGCSHCCHIGVTMLDTEAQAIGREIGVEPANPPEGRYLLTDFASDADAYAAKAGELSTEFAGTPCPFLNPEGQCLVYSHRPPACRTQFNLDVDGLLCRLVPGGQVPVPYWDNSLSKLAYVTAFGMNHKMADIRYFFPNGLAGRSSEPKQ